MFCNPLFQTQINTFDVADFISAYKVPANRNFIMSKNVFTSGLETSTSSAILQTLSSTNEYNTVVTGSLPFSYGYPSVDLTLPSNWITVVAVNMANSPGTVSINVNGGSWTGTDSNVLITKISGQQSYFKTCLFQVPIGFAELSSMSFTFNKNSNRSMNMQKVFVFPGKWEDVMNNTSTGAATTTVSVLQNDLVLNVSDVSGDYLMPYHVKSGTSTATRIFETRSQWYTTSGGESMYAVDSAGTFIVSYGFVEVYGTTTTAYYPDGYSQVLRFIEP